ncbi:E3 ubiquitin-protein ligase AIRP2-like isoform X3 [Cynara cardunculus var. scolymus]|uniref:E3 ubiquitin-protein ligase AIRP2-like isoform X3 n=1 Tax=Cynara cardunculus var. scolymus TaxID=59895 RepID=UPI000D62EC3E|nr:E3 ubiquitin-protein ligase AIRP2-like isoform X3 [Cynara cardunculus var. scolymus]
MMDNYYYHQLASCPSYRDSLKVLEVDIQFANMLAASIPRDKGGACLRMELGYNDMAYILSFLLQWINFPCSCLLQTCLSFCYVIVHKVLPDGRPKLTSLGRKASIREFYDVILPSLKRLRTNPLELDVSEDECGICLEPCTKMVLPNCCHAMCINCYHDWNMRSVSCPFCRGSLKRVNSGDLWVLPCMGDVVDQKTVSKEDKKRFYNFINKLPKDIPDAVFLVYNDYLI